MIPPELVGAKTVTRSHRLTFFIDEGSWRDLRSKDLRVTRMLTHIGRSSFKQYSVVTLSEKPIFSLTTTVIAVDDTLHRSIHLPLADVMRAAMASQAPRAARVRGLPWTPWAAPGGGSEHGGDLMLSPRPDNAFCLRTTARWVESDEFGHISQSQYALLVEEARAASAAAGGYGQGAVSVDASAPPERFDIDYVGQALPGDKLCIFTWWDGESFCCEMEKEGDNGCQGKLLTVSRLWVMAEPQTSKM